MLTVGPRSMIMGVYRAAGSKSSPCAGVGAQAGEEDVLVDARQSTTSIIPVVACRKLLSDRRPLGRGSEVSDSLGGKSRIVWEFIGQARQWIRPCKVRLSLDSALMHPMETLWNTILA